jgi:hypothetical protein
MEASYKLRSPFHLVSSTLSLVMEAKAKFNGLSMAGEAEEIARAGIGETNKTDYLKRRKPRKERNLFFVGFKDEGNLSSFIWQTFIHVEHFWALPRPDPYEPPSPVPWVTLESQLCVSS